MLLTLYSTLYFFHFYFFLILFIPIFPNPSPIPSFPIPQFLYHYAGGIFYFFSVANILKYFCSWEDFFAGPLAQLSLAFLSYYSRSSHTLGSLKGYTKCLQRVCQGYAKGLPSPMLGWHKYFRKFQHIEGSRPRLRSGALAGLYPR